MRSQVKSARGVGAVGEVVQREVSSLPRPCCISFGNGRLTTKIVSDNTSCHTG